MRNKDVELELGLLELEEKAIEKRKLKIAHSIIEKRADALCITVEQYLRRKSAQRRAKEVGLHAWPCFMDRWNIDPKAFVVAEEILYKQTGEYYSPRYKAGWDFNYGYRGICANDVSNSWYAAGCKDNWKFRFQIANNFIAKKKDSKPFLLNFRRGLRWLRSIGLSDSRIGSVSRKAVAALGKLSTPWRRHAAIHGVDFERTVRDSGLNYVTRTVRIRDLNWDRIRLIERLQKEAAVNRRTMPWVDMHYWLHSEGLCREECVSVLYPQYRRCDMGILQDLYKGKSPKELVPDLSKEELTDFATGGWFRDFSANPVDSIVQYLTTRYEIPRSVYVPVLRWMQRLKDRNAWVQMEKVRTVFLPGNREHKFKWIDIVDEIRPEDIHGLNDSPAKVFERAKSRREKEAELNGDNNPLTNEPSWVSSLPEGVRRLNTSRELWIEGKAMHHCVGGYADAVRRGRCHILSLWDGKTRSTAEISSSLTVVYQHRGEYNGQVTTEARILLDKTLKAIRKAA